MLRSLINGALRSGKAGRRTGGTGMGTGAGMGRGTVGRRGSGGLGGSVGRSLLSSFMRRR